MDRSTYEIRLGHWAQVVQAANARPKGQLLKDWLSENDISKDQYYYWQRKVRTAVYNRLQEDKELPAVSAPDTDISFIEVPVPKQPAAQSPVCQTGKDVAAIRTPAALIQAGNVSIVVSNDISETLLLRILREVSHA